jgi:hypothetical protein
LKKARASPGGVIPAGAFAVAKARVGNLIRFLQEQIAFRNIISFI